MIRIEYSANNSGGDWWIEDEHWLALEEAGWVVQWVKDDAPGRGRWADAEGRWLGALATTAHRDGLTYEQAIREFEDVTGLYVGEDQGCPTCGDPHYFYERHIVDYND